MCAEWPGARPAPPVKKMGLRTSWKAAATELALACTPSRTSSVVPARTVFAAVGITPLGVTSSPAAVPTPTVAIAKVPLGSMSSCPDGVDAPRIRSEGGSPIEKDRAG